MLAFSSAAPLHPGPQVPGAGGVQLPSDECTRIASLVQLLRAQGDEESDKRYQLKLDEMAASKKVEPPLQQKVNQAYHSMRSLEARLSKAVEAFERISNELVQA
eukprot:1533878-Pyramimonas_sp.AAC.1